MSDLELFLKFYQMVRETKDEDLFEDQVKSLLDVIYKRGFSDGFMRAMSRFPESAVSGSE